MSVRGVKLDEDLSPIVAKPFRDAGLKVATVVEQGWSGLADQELWKRVVAEGFFLVTADKGFGDIRAYSPGDHPGILLLRPDRESILEFQSLVSMVLAQYNLETLSGTLTVATPARIRIRQR